MSLLTTLLLMTLIQPAQVARPQDVYDRAVSSFEQGRVVEAAREFDTLAKLIPDQAPELWQRGIALYYAGRYKDCREQFESHRTVNPNDVENAVWHFLCVARQTSAQDARKALLPVGPDARVPMKEVYGLFQGTRTPEDVLAAAGTDLRGQFYAQLYLGLYFEANGDTVRARDHIAAAAADKFAAAGGYMHMVASVHKGLLQQRNP